MADVRGGWSSVGRLPSASTSSPESEESRILGSGVCFEYVHGQRGVRRAAEAFRTLFFF